MANTHFEKLLYNYDYVGKDVLEIQLPNPGEVAVFQELQPHLGVGAYTVRGIVQAVHVREESHVLTAFIVLTDSTIIRQAVRQPSKTI